MKEQKIVESYSVVTQVKPLVRPDIQLPKLEKSELDMISEEKAQYIYIRTVSYYSWVHNRRVYLFIWNQRNMKKETDTKTDKSI